MYRPRQYAVDDPATLHEVIAAHPFASIAAVSETGVQFAYAPVVLDRNYGERGGVRFHLARENPLTRATNGTRLYFSFRGPDAYISPDWYRSPAMVPTWNYIAVEASGEGKQLDDRGLRELLVDLSAHEEAKLAPKKPWTIDKVPAERQQALLGAIVGFSVSFDTLKGKFKLSQEKSADDFAGAVAGLETRGDPASVAVAAEMKAHR
jgi:transcriptional regulator